MTQTDSAPVIQAACRNLILSRLDPKDFALLAEHLKPARWATGTVLYEQDAEVEDVYFFEEGILSVIAKTPGAQASEVGIVGREGFVPVLAVLGGERTLHEMLMQVEGRGWRIGREALLDCAARSVTLHRTLSRFALVMVVQTSYTALSNAVHPITERLARWLLMCHDRSASDDLDLTHEFMALMLSVRRPSVTTALHTLEGAGYIRAERGCVFVKNRAGLEAFAADAYGRPEREYLEHLGPLR